MAAVTLSISRTVIPGKVKGRAVVTRQPLSLWGGLDPARGVVIEKGHELEGRSWAGFIFAYPEGRGSSTSAAVLVDAVRSGRAPLAVINITTDPVLVTGCIIAEVLYEKRIPVVEVPAESFERLVDGVIVAVDTDLGMVVVEVDEKGTGHSCGGDSNGQRL
ncbi:MAG: DUF126 domain-containing protein [Firmicutes bacterium]|nr:DUF126 domain-containing protein [Bacillota bacterium]